MIPDVRSEIQSAINALQILEMRLSGHANLIPKEFAKFTDRQMSAAAVQAVLAIHMLTTEADR